jgi:hypothetical protein
MQENTGKNVIEIKCDYLEGYLIFWKGSFSGKGVSFHFE